MLAVQDLTGEAPGAKHYRRNHLAAAARQWISSPADAVGSFTWVCHQMGVEPDPARRRLLRASPARASPAASSLAKTIKKTPP